MNLYESSQKWKASEVLGRFAAGTYVDYSHNYGANAVAIRFGDLQLYFSYGKIVAFKVDGQHPVVVKNVFSMTTGKHLNYIDGGDYKSRLSVEEFEEALSTLFYE